MGSKKLIMIVFVVLFEATGLWSQSASSNSPQVFNVGDVTVAPTRIIFEGRDRTAEVILINQSEKTHSYSLQFINLRMTESGEMQQISLQEPGDFFADSMIRFTPRRVILEPKKSQVVRLQLRKPAGLAPGEYRSHLVFQVVPSTDKDEGLENPQPLEEKTLGIQLIAIYGVSIPIIVREGLTSAKVALSNIEVIHSPENAAPLIRFGLERTGNQSVYGNIEAEYVQQGRTAIIVGKIKGIAVYTPNAKRIVTLPLKLPDGVSLKGGTLRVRFLDPVITKNSSFSVLASGAISLP